LFLVEWVRGEILYNRSLQTGDSTLSHMALAHLKRSQELRGCGARTERVADLINIIEKDFEKSGPAKPLLEAAAGTDVLTEGRSGDPGPNILNAATRPRPEPIPVCDFWLKLRGNELSAWPRALSTKASLPLPRFSQAR
jgi:hypothetical protein